MKLRTSYYMTVICCEPNCRRFIGFAACPPERVGIVSHGICKRCLKKRMEQVGKMKVARD